MNIKPVLLIVSLTLFLYGCASMPLTPQQLRDVSDVNNFVVRTEIFIVNRPYREAVKTIKSRAEPCLRGVVRNIKSKDKKRGIPFKPTFVTRKNMSELHVQTRSKSIILTNSYGKIGKEGWYAVVADIRPEGSNKTRLDIHHLPKMGLITAAIVNWAKGDFLGCPDLTKIH